MTKPSDAMADALSRWPADGALEVLTFNLANETFAVDAAIVREILDLLPETPVPGAPGFASSIINFRGKVIALADLRLAFGMGATEQTIDSRIIVIELPLAGEPTLIGIRTDKVNEVTTLSRDDFEAPPSVGMRWRLDYIDGLVRRNGQFVILPNLHAIFSPAQAKAA